MEIDRSKETVELRDIGVGMVFKFTEIEKTKDELYLKTHSANTENDIFNIRVVNLGTGSLLEIPENHKVKTIKGKFVIEQYKKEE